VARRRKKINTYKVSAGKPEGKRPIRKHWKVWTGFIGPKKGTVAGFESTAINLRVV
jgi:hypothetical protein